jgi:3-phenylpropionate/cinnamic acid dioxygenase small subunit
MSEHAYRHICNLLYRYAELIDDGDFEGVARLFTKARIIAATARSRFTVLQQTAELPLQVIIAGRYHDRFECIDGAWHFSEREMKTELYGDLSRHLLFDAKLLH